MIGMRSIKHHVIALLAGVIFISSCTGESEQVQQKQKESDKGMSFFAYHDTLMKVESLNQQLETNFTPSQLGQPIGVMETPFWLITVGPWHMNNRNILVQGSVFQLGNPFYPNPIRKVEVEFEGPFEGVVKYDGKTDLYSWLVQPAETQPAFEYQRTVRRHLLIVGRTENGIRLVDIASAREVVVEGSQGNLIDWSMNEEAETIIFMLKSDTQTAFITEEFLLDELFPANE